MRTKLALAFGLLLGIGFLYGAVGSWVGVARAEGSSRTAGVVRDEQCGYRNACTGLFSSDDGSLRSHRVVVSGGNPQSSVQRAVFVPRIGNGLDGAIQSDDTAYIGSVTLNIAPSVAIAVVLSVLGLLFTLPYVLIGGLVLGRRRRPRFLGDAGSPSTTVAALVGEPRSAERDGTRGVQGSRRCR